MKKQITIIIVLLSMISYSQNKLQTTNSFQEGLKTWQYGTWGANTDVPGGFISAESKGQDDKGGCARIQVDKTTENSHKMFLRSIGVKIEKNKKYRLTFWIKSNASHSLVNVQFYSNFYTGSVKSWGGILSKDVAIKGNNEWEKITLDFKAKDQFEGSPVDYNAVALSFGFSKYKGVYFIDNVNVVEK